MKRKVFCILLCVVCMTMFLSLSVNADMGPKASVHILFENMGDELCYGTLLSSRESTGPDYVWNGKEEDARHNENENYEYVNFDYATWKAFAEYKDIDGYYFLQIGWQVNETKELAWTYMPPNSFKILLYYPETETFIVSGICERYAFDTYYTVDMEGVNIGSVEYNENLSKNDRINAYRSYNYAWEMLSLIARIVLTILLEIGIALLFGYRTKKQFALIAGVNVVTQIVLNVLLNIINYNSGPLVFLLFYVLFELIVFVIEATLFYKFLNSQKKYLAVIYALVANVVSFAAGMGIAVLIPGIF